MTFLEAIVVPTLFNMFYNYGADKVSKITQKFGGNEKSLKKLFVSSFIDSINSEKKHHFNLSNFTKTLEEFIKKINANNDRFFVLVKKYSNDYQSNFLNIIEDQEIKEKFLNELFTSYGIEFPDSAEALFVNLHQDLLSNFKINFIKNLSSNPADQIIFQEILKIDHIIQLLQKLDVRISEYDEIKQILLTLRTNTDATYKKNIDEYDAYIIRKFEYLELAGFSPKISGKDIYMKLMDVFVPLHIESTSSQSQDNEKYDEDYDEVVNDSFYEKYNSNVSLAMKKILDNNALVILGDPGSGKSTLVKYISSYIVQNRANLNLNKNLVPIFFRVADYAEYYKQNRKSLYEFIVEDIHFSTLFKDNFEYSNVLILLDGLDEITDYAIRNNVVKNIIDLKSRYPKNKYIVTSRIIGYRESTLNGHFIESQLLPFTKEDIQQFARQWYQSIAKSEIQGYTTITPQESDDIRVKYEGLASELYKSISRNSSVIKFATNPLLMTIVAMIFFRSKKLPNKRVELYDIATETFLENWVKIRFEENTKLKDKGAVLEILPHIAFKIHSWSSKGLISELDFRNSFVEFYISIYESSKKEALSEFNDFKDFLEKYAGFFYRKDIEGDYYGFVHLTFEEYLCALEFSSKWELKELTIKDYIFHSRWVEVIRLAAANLKISHKGKLGRVKATNFIQDILEPNNDLFPTAYRPLQLSLLILADDVEVETHLKNFIIDKFLGVIENPVEQLLLTTFSQLLSELLQSLHKEDFITKLNSRIRETDRIASKNNLIRLLMPLYEFDEVNQVILHLLQTHISIDPFVDYHSSIFFNKDFLFTPHIINLIRDYLLKNSDNERKIFDVFKIYLQSFGINSQRYFNLSSRDLELFVNALNSEDDESIKKMYFKFILMFLDVKRALPGEKMDILDKIQDMNIKNIITYTQTVASANREINHGTSFKNSKIDNQYMITSNEHGGNLIVDYKNFFVLEFSTTQEIEDIINTINTEEYPNLNIDKIEELITILQGPEKCKCPLNFYLSSKSSDLLHFFGWAKFAIENLNSNHEMITHFISATKLNLSYFDADVNDAIEYLVKTPDFAYFPPHLKILLLKKINQNFNFSLVKECILFYESMQDSDEKSATYKLLYAHLNPFNLIIRNKHLS